MITPTGPQISAALREIKWPVLAMFAFDVAVMVAYLAAGWRWVAVPDLPLSVFGATLGIVLSFRNSSTYQRWWEARTLWGSIVNYSRNLSRQVATMILPPGENAVRRKIIHHQIAYLYALKHQLRGGDPWADLKLFFEPHEIASLSLQRNIPVEIQRRMGLLLQDCFERGWLDSIRWSALDATITALANAQGGIERIKATPFPRQYSYFQQFFVRVYCVLLPFGMVASLGVFTPIGSSLVGLILMLLDVIGRDLEDPFNNSIHDVPLAAICRTIEINLRQQLDEENVPAPEEPVDGVLW